MGTDRRRAAPTFELRFLGRPMSRPPVPALVTGAEASGRVGR
jgi:hypothetical protein